jgi:carbon-monoxide dehydrogenase large subunit
MTTATTIPSPVGESVPRIDAREKVTGAALFADDLQFGPGLLYARIKRSPHPHALIKKIDVSKALALPRQAVATSMVCQLLACTSRRIFCTDRVRCVGDPVPGVAAINEIAEQAVNRSRSVRGWSRADPGFGVAGCAAASHGFGPVRSRPFILLTAPMSFLQDRKGNARARDRCAAIVERKYHVRGAAHSHRAAVAVALVDEAGKVTLWGSSQSPFAQRNLIAKTLGISQSDMRVIAPYVGGGFGSKAGVSMEALAVAIAMKVKGHPVKLRLTREEEFFTCFVRQGLVGYFKMGAASGKLLGRSIGMAALIPSMA